ncbi:WD40-repeat-containing domain protein [Cantharellus anzutake]|uniref:WD40-repeat-containing domain protein n=1 Tax=Cantharellus anzutake TaxID=1750568 RepID=UPI001908DC7B|nr:WD40-repeat-containing domain protein [Cantharellus anzutake]KAF8330843.1 WD40-repeat-containing domain protein [Cantharellus anzutake]
MLVQLFKAESTWASVRNEIQAYQFKPSADDYQPSNNQMRRSNTDIELAVRTLELLSSCQSTEDLARQQRFRLNQETTNLKARLACTLLESAQFACRSWSVLVCRVDCGDADVMQALEKFAESWLLHWVAAMGIMEELDAACLSLHRIEQWMRPCTDKKELRTYISDVCRFILRYKQALRQSSFFILNAPLPFSRSAGLNSVGSSSSNQPAPYSITLLTGVGHSWSQSPVQLRGHPGPVSSVAFSHDGDRIISTCRNNQIWIWNAAVGNLARTLDLDSTCIFAVFSPDGTQIACALEDNTKIYIFGANDMPGQPLRLHGHTNRVNSLSFSPYGFKLASASSDGTVRIWNCESGSSERILRGHTHPVVSVDYSRDGVLLASAGGWTVCLWDVLTGHMRFQVDLKSAVYSVSFTADNTQVLFAAVDGSVGLLQVDGNGEPQLVGQHRGAVYSVSCAPVGNYVVSGSADKSVCLWDVRSRTLVRTFNGHVSDIYSVAFSPDSERVVSGSQDGSVRIWDKPKARADMTTNSFVIAFSLDGKLTASTSEDKIIRINLRGSSHPPVLLRGHTDMVTCACFSSNGRNLTSGSRDLTVKLWDTNSGSCLIEMAIGDATQFRDFQWAPQAPYHIGYSLCNRVLCVRGWGIADKFGRSYTLYLNSKNLDDDPTHLPKAIFPSISVPDPFLPIILDQNCLCVRSRGALKYVCWLPDDFEPASEVIQIGRRVTVGGKGGEIIHVDFKEFDLKWL